ncbi:MAG: aminotransferase class V-fold PLP-dependent enzyme [Chloroflexi bacterium]|nr:aminotransferase class V-fold PLP-dependent enzyme [Chloroflexota bacterium]
MRDYFLLDPSVAFLNHGSFGATPRPVFAAYQFIQAEMERQPVEFLGRLSDKRLRASREVLGAFLNAGADNLVYVMNATWGVNVVAHSLELVPGDEILTTDHEYGACVNAWKLACSRTGAQWVEAQIPLPLPDPAAIVDLIWSKVTPRTKVLYLSHITSPTAVTFPVEELCKRARAAGILSVIDGAHAPGQLPVDLTALGADIYTGNLHKWLCAPKGAAFLYARPEHHGKLHALVTSWGYSGFSTLLDMQNDSLLALRHQWQGTRDIAAFLAVPAAIDFQREHDWPAHRQRCHLLAADAQRRVSDLTGIPIAVPEHNFTQMALCELPPSTDLAVLKTRLYDEFRVEIPVIDWLGRKFVRVSIQAYNTVEDVDRLVQGLKAILGL